MLMKCAEHGYTMEGKCPTCAAATFRPGPAKYSPEDAYGKYRRKLKLLEREKGGRITNEGSP